MTSPLNDSKSAPDSAKNNPLSSRLSVQFELEPLKSPAELGVHAEELYDLMRLDHQPPNKEEVGFSKKGSSNLKQKDDPFINWLSAMRLNKYHDLFVSNNISFDMLGDLNKEDMKVLVPRVGDRIRIWKAITGLLATSPSPETSVSSSNAPSPSVSNHNTNTNPSPLTTVTTPTGASSSSKRKHKPAPDPRFKRVTFHTLEKKALHVELLPTTQILSYVRHCAKMSTERPIKVNDGFDIYHTDETVRIAIFDLNVREFWIEPPESSNSSSSVNLHKQSMLSSRNRSKSSSSTHTVSGGRRTKPNTPTREFDEFSLTAPLPPVPAPRTSSNPSSATTPTDKHTAPPRQSSVARNNRLSTRTIVNPVDRPTSHEVSKRLSEYFPDIDQKQLDEGIRNSKLISSRFSTINGSWRSSFRYSKRFSTVSTVGRQSLFRDNATVSSLLQESDTDYELLERLDSEEMTPSVWLRGQLVGNGSFGSVYLAFNMATGEIIAVKQVTLNDKVDKNKMVESLRREVSFLRELDHDNIVQYRGFKREGNKINIFLEYISGGSLASRIARKGPIAEDSTRIYIKQCLLGLAYLHDKGIIHRDIKGANILVDSDYKVKISDFGLSKYEQPGAQRFSMQGTAFWMAPEVARARDSTTTKADIWSLGCLIIEMVTGEHPFPKLQAFQAIYKIGSGSTPDIPAICSPDLKNFLGRCLKTDPKERATAHELLQHPFITG